MSLSAYAVTSDYYSPAYGQRSAFAVASDYYGPAYGQRSAYAVVSDYAISGPDPSGMLVWNSITGKWESITKYVFSQTQAKWVPVVPAEFLYSEGPMTQAEYDALGSWDPNTLYLVSG